MNKDYLFISDIHLGLFTHDVEVERENKLLEFLQFAKSNASKLFILGDLFDYWFEYKTVIQKDFFRTINALYELTSSGVEVHYFIGNHDFLHKDFFKKRINVKLHYDPLEILIEGKKIFLGHGDGLVKNDIGYKILKKLLRNKILQGIYSMIHPDLGIKLASSTSKKSRDYTSNKHYGYEDGLYETAISKFNTGVDFVVFGHSHVRMHREYENHTYINLGTWLDKPCYGKFDGTNFEIIDWK